MRTAFIWVIEDLVFPCEAAEIRHTKIGERGQEDEHDDEGHGDDCTAWSAARCKQELDLSIMYVDQLSIHTGFLLQMTLG